MIEIDKMSKSKQDRRTPQTKYKTDIDAIGFQTKGKSSYCGRSRITRSRHHRHRQLGMEYKWAAGATIPNLGEWRCLMRTEQTAEARHVNMQVADAHKKLS